MAATIPLESPALLFATVNQEELVAILLPETRMETLLTAREVAFYLKLSKSKVYYMIAQKQIPHVRIGKMNVRIRQTDLQVWLEKSSVATTQTQ